jgi:hypothetical protein
MSAICSFNQYGHCKYGSECGKIHTTVTCDNFPCQDSECSKRHPQLCKYFSVYGRCMFANKCSFLHYSFGRGDDNPINGLQEFTRAVSELREEVRTLRQEVDRLGSVNQQHLLEMIKDLKAEIDVDRVMRQEKENGTEAGFKKVYTKLSDAYTNQKQLLERIKDLEREIDEDKAGRDSLAVNPRVEDGQWNAKGAMATDEGDYTAWSRDRPYEENGRTGNKTKKGKPAAPGMSSSSATNRTPEGNIGHGRERN